MRRRKSGKATPSRTLSRATAYQSKPTIIGRRATKLSTKRTLRGPSACRPAMSWQILSSARRGKPETPQAASGKCRTAQEARSGLIRNGNARTFL